jgi:uncharacterized membrane protein YhhN
MSFLLYIPFWIFACIAIIIRSVSRIEVKTPILATIKAIPAILAVIIIFLEYPTPNLFQILLMVALVFCALGDFSIEFALIAGLGMFLIAQIFYSINFIWHAFLESGFMLSSWLALVVSLIITLIYARYLVRYLQTSTEIETPAEMFKAVMVYAIVLSLTLSASLMFEVATGAGVFAAIGAFLFLISDSLIGVKEFHHEFAFQDYLILITYYLSIFFLSLTAFIYVI